jgi:hypothetical protein
MEKLARDKHSSLLQEFVNYGHESFITLAPEHKKDLTVSLTFGIGSFKTWFVVGILRF